MSNFYPLSKLPQSKPVDEIAIGTGWWELDQIWKIYPGQFNVVTGYPNHGKSTFLLNVICNIARKYDARTFMYVPENERHIRTILRRIWGDEDGFDHFAEHQCFVQSSQPDAYNTKPKTLSWVLEEAIKHLEECGIDFLLIDPWNEIERAKPKEQLMTDYIGECLMHLKQMAKRHNITITMVAHPTKEPAKDGKVPGLHDIEGSMNWWNKSDNGLVVYRPDMGPSVQVISSRVRELGSGKRGQCFFHVDEKTGRFTPQYGASG